MQTKYFDLLCWVEAQPANAKFGVREASKQTMIHRKTIASVFYPLRRQGYLGYYGKGAKWNLEKALEANSLRLRLKYQIKAKHLVNKTNRHRKSKDYIPVMLYDENPKR